MKNSPVRYASSLLLALVSACTPAPGRTGVAAGPAGEWIDLAKTTPTDTMIWVLAPGGSDGLLHVGIVQGPDGQLRRHEERRHYGRWSIGADPEGRPTLCFNRRPGRQPPSCSAFRLDTIPGQDRTRRRLSITAYQGRHHLGERVLLEREP
jgi:hypothetical protein